MITWPVNPNIYVLTATKPRSTHKLDRGCIIYMIKCLCRFLCLVNLCFHFISVSDCCWIILIILPSLFHIWLYICSIYQGDRKRFEVQAMHEGGHHRKKNSATKYALLTHLVSKWHILEIVITQLSFINCLINVFAGKFHYWYFKHKINDKPMSITSWL